MTRSLIPPLLLAALLPAGCYEKDHDTQDTSDTAPDWIPCLPAHGADGQATITADGVAAAAIQATGWASILAVDEYSPIPFAARHLLARGSGGTVGILARDPDAEDDDEIPFRYVDLSAAKLTPETVADDAGAIEEAALFFESDDTPVVFRMTAPEGFTEQVRTPSGKDGPWPEPTFVDPSTGLGGPPTTLSEPEFWTDVDGRMHVVAKATLGVTSRVLHGVRGAGSGSSWEFESFEPAPATDFATYRTDADGGLHAVYTATEPACNPCDMSLYYGYLPPGGTWTEAVIEPSVWNEPDDEYAYDASLQVTSEGLPIVAATWMNRAMTGALLHTELRLYSVKEGDGTWCSEVVEDEADTYQGERGTGFTGVNPNLVLDASDRPHVVFSDTALWYDDKARANSLSGQIRYAVRTGDRWTVTTLLSQQGQADSPDMLYGMEAPMVAPSEDGTDVAVAGALRAWATSSVYNTTPANVTFQAAVVEASVTYP